MGAAGMIGPGSLPFQSGGDSMFTGHDPGRRHMLTAAITIHATITMAAMMYSGLNHGRPGVSSSPGAKRGLPTGAFAHRGVP